MDNKCEKMRRDIFAKIKDKYGFKLGCYEVFELTPKFRQILNLTKYPALLEEFAGFIENQIAVYAYENLKYVVMWAWDGDGTLLIWKRIDHKAYINTDCKCTYGWQEVDAP